VGRAYIPLSFTDALDSLTSNSTSGPRLDNADSPPLLGSPLLARFVMDAIISKDYINFIIMRFRFIAQVVFFSTGKIAPYIQKI
jgi:hypothetical protein